MAHRPGFAIPLTVAAESGKNSVAAISPGRQNQEQHLVAGAGFTLRLSGGFDNSQSTHLLS